MRPSFSIGMFVGLLVEWLIGSYVHWLVGRSVRLKRILPFAKTQVFYSFLGAEMTIKVLKALVFGDKEKLC